MRRATAALAAALLALGGCRGDGGATRTPTSELRMGTGYLLQVPSDWEDVSERAREQTELLFDRQFAGTPRDGFRTNVVVDHRERPRGLDLDGVGRAARSEVRGGSAGGSEVTRTQPLRLGGEPALAYGYRLGRRDPPLRGETVVTLHRGRLYLVTFTAAASAFASEREHFRRILSSWTWDP